MAIALLLFHILGAISSVHAIMSTRTAQGAVAWVVSLNTFPYIAVPAYWVLGRNKFQGYVTARQLVDEELIQVAPESVAHVEEFMIAHDELTPRPRTSSTAESELMPVKCSRRPSGQTTSIRSISTRFYNTASGMRSSNTFEWV